MSNVVPPPLQFDTWKCPKCGHKEKIARQRPLCGPLNASGGFIKNMLYGKEEHRCPKCGTKMVS